MSLFSTFKNTQRQAFVKYVLKSYSVKNVKFASEAISNIIGNSKLSDLKILEQLIEWCSSHLNSKPIGNDRSEHRLEIIEELLQDYSPSSILDLGCGDAAITRQVAQRYSLSADQVYGVELEVSPQPDITLIKADRILTDIPESSVSLIMCFMVLHHLKDVDRTLLQIRSRLAPNGLLILREHHVSSRRKHPQNALIQLIHAWIELQKTYVEKAPIALDLDELTESIHLRTQEYWRLKLESFGFEWLRENVPRENNPQGIYHEVYRLRSLNSNLEVLMTSLERLPHTQCLRSLVYTTKLSAQLLDWLKSKCDVELYELTLNSLRDPAVTNLLTEILHLIQLEFQKFIPKLPLNADLSTPEKRRAKFVALQNYSADFELSEGYSIKNLNTQEVSLDYNGEGPALLLETSGTYSRINDLSDYWMESIRSQKYRHSQLSMQEYWNLYHTKFDKLPRDQQRDALYSERGVEVNAFRPSVASVIYRTFRGESLHILDACSGWGDRLLAAMAVNADSYTGVDPNLELHSKYAEMIEEFKSQSSTKVHLLSTAFEDATFDRMFDLAFTSPPYYDLEVYDSSSSQSIVRHTTLANWISQWLVPMILRQATLVKPGGYVLININDYINEDGYPMQICASMIQQVEAAQKLIYHGVISYATIHQTQGELSPQPIFVWSVPLSEKV